MRPDTDASIRILLVDGRSLFRQAVGGVLNAVDGLEVVAESHSPQQAVRDADRTQPDVVVVDGDMDVSGLPDLVVALKETVLGCRVLVLTTEERLAPLVDALRAGATGYLTKETSMSELIDATRSVHRGDFVVPPSMLGELLTTLVNQGGRTNDSIKTLSKLTRREREVLALLADGSNKDAIAEALAISPQTARTHVQNILAKLGLHSRLEAAAFARKHPILKDLVAAD
ncbi:MAG: response regulator transcription factor [Actinomycetota bacterium]